MSYILFFTRKNGIFLQIYRKKLAYFGVNFILQTFCSCKKNDKYQVWNHVCMTCLSSFGFVYIVLRQPWLSRRKKQLVEIMYVRYVCLCLVLFWDSLDFHAEKKNVCPICWSLLNSVLRQSKLSRRFSRWKRIGRNDVCPLCIDHICVTRQTSQITIQPPVL